MAEPLMKLLDQEEEIEELQGQEGKVLTFVADEGNEPENFGFKLEEDHRLPTPGPHPNTDEDFEEFDGAEILAGREDDGGINLDDQRVHHEVGVALTGSITVNGVELTAESPLRNLRAACSFYKIGRGGGEQSAMEGSLTVRISWSLLLARDLAARGRAFDERVPTEQAMVQVPTEEEKRRRLLTHLPYAGWCASCVKHRAKQDQRRRTGRAHEQGVPTISFHLCKVRASGSGARGEVEDDEA